MQPATKPALVPADLLETIEQATHAHAISVVPRAGGGASRQGAEIVLRREDGSEQSGYLSYDTRMGDPMRQACFRREVAILQALSGPLSDRGVRAPQFLASDRNHLALLTALTPGSDMYTETGADQEVGRDFIGQLAALHRIDPASVALDGFGDPAIPPSQRIREGIASARRENVATLPDPILLLALAWLEAHVPEDRGPSVIVHGDAGPGNFLQQDGRVTALLDWELCHYGDPAEDLAQIWVRTLFRPFMSPRDVLSAYEAAGGGAIDIDRVRYHRLYFQVGFMVSSHAALHGCGGVRPATIGVSMLFYMAHMRVIVQSLAELTDTTLRAVPLTHAAPGWRDRTFEIALEDLRDIIAPRAADQQAAGKAKALARLVKYWRARDLDGAAYDLAEIAEISAALANKPEDVAASRLALSHAILEDRIGFAGALQLCHARMTRETALMGDAMGSFRDTYFPPFET